MGEERVFIIGEGEFLRGRVKSLLERLGFTVTCLPGDISWLEEVRESLEGGIVILSPPSEISPEEMERVFSLLPRAEGVIIATGEGETPVRGKRTITPESSDEEIAALVRSIVYEGRNTRKSPRVWTSIPVEYTAAGDRRVSDIVTLSYYGAFIRTLSPPPRGEVVTLRFRLGDRVVRAKGPVLYTVVFSPEGATVIGDGGGGINVVAFPGFAVYFEEISPEDSALVRALVDRG
ncbi:MAG: hypothetical protein D6713_06610 [Deltaproteobacteria bacterium]|nr:MAG: hypothetical protein D6713_06610 [Deltaproteobacteria bacterium]